VRAVNIDPHLWKNANLQAGAVLTLYCPCGSHPAPGIAYSEIAEEIASAQGLRPVVTPTSDRHLRVAQSNISDAQFLQVPAASLDELKEGIKRFPAIFDVDRHATACLARAVPLHGAINHGV